MIPVENLQTENQPATLSDKKIFIKIWTEPRLVFKFINDTKHDKYVHILLILAGIARGFDNASAKNMGDKMPLLGVIALSMLAGGVFGYMTYYIYATMMSWAGQWLRGVGNTSSILRMLSYAMLPSILTLFILMPQIILFGNGMFQGEINMDESSLLSTMFFYVSLLIQLTLGIWTVCLVVVGTSEVQKISIGKSILNIILPGLIVIVAMTIIVIGINLLK